MIEDYFISQNQQINKKLPQNLIFENFHPIKQNFFILNKINK